MLEDFEKQSEAFATTGAVAGIDLGEKTIGLAVSDPDRRVATPVETIRRRRFTQDAETLIALLEERGVVGLVFGLPLNMDGSEGPRAQSTRAFARNLGKKTAIPIAFWDERLSTSAMERDLIEKDFSRRRRAEQIDALAATFILQGAIDRLRGLKQ